MLGCSFDRGYGTFKYIWIIHTPTCIIDDGHMHAHASCMHLMCICSVRCGRRMAGGVREAEDAREHGEEQHADDDILQVCQLGYLSVRESICLSVSLLDGRSVRMYVCMHVCMYVSMYVCCIHVCVCVCVSACVVCVCQAGVCLCLSLFVCTSARASMHTCLSFLHTH
jgi:hypothetical protein